MVCGNEIITFTNDLTKTSWDLWIFGSKTVTDLSTTLPTLFSVTPASSYCGLKPVYDWSFYTDSAAMVPHTSTTTSIPVVKFSFNSNGTVDLS